MGGERNPHDNAARPVANGIEQHYSTRELAALLNAHPETIRRAAARGLLRSVRVGSERRYPASAVEDYLERNAEAPR
jgi:excisionase family DNA binding protein